MFRRCFTDHPFQLGQGRRSVMDLIVRFCKLKVMLWPSILSTPIESLNLVVLIWNLPHPSASCEGKGPKISIALYRGPSWILYSSLCWNHHWNVIPYFCSIITPLLWQLSFKVTMDLFQYSAWVIQYIRHFMKKIKNKYRHFYWCFFHTVIVNFFLKEGSDSEGIWHCKHLLLKD